MTEVRGFVYPTLNSGGTSGAKGRELTKDTFQIPCFFVSECFLVFFAEV